MIGVVQALAGHLNVHDRGFTFLGAKGPGDDLFVSFHQLRLEVMRRAAQLRALGLRKGDRLALVIPEGQDFIPTFLGALWAGIVPVPLYPPLSLGKLDAFMEALINILNVAKPKALVTTEQVGKVLWSVVSRVPSLEKVIMAEELAAPFAQAIPASEEPEPLADSDLAFLQFTSGSTAAPKGVMVTHGNLAANCHAIFYGGLRGDALKDKAVSWLPLYHDMGLIGLVITPTIVGVSVVYIPTLRFIKNATIWLETMSKHKATLSFGPNFSYALVTKRARPEQIARWDLSQVRVFGCGAEPINPDTLRAFIKAMAPAGLKPTALLPSYGMAEATLAMTFIGLDEELKTDRIDAGDYHAEQKATAAKEGALALEVVSCGRPFALHEISIQAEGQAGRMLPERAVGEICFRGPSVAAGYWTNPEATRAAGMGPQGDGWLRTGDLGYLAGGELFISGRSKDILIVNGRNYYPQRIEWLVEELPGVRKGSAVVFSRPGKASEEVVVAAETRAPDLEALSAAIKSRISEELQLSVADVILVQPGALPKTSSGKLQRRKTRDHYLSGRLGKEGVRTLGAMGSRFLVAKHIAYSLVGRARHQARGLFKRFLPPPQA